MLFSRGREQPSGSVRSSQHTQISGQEQVEQSATMISSASARTKFECAHKMSNVLFCKPVPSKNPPFSVRMSLKAAGSVPVIPLLLLTSRYLRAENSPYDVGMVPVNRLDPRSRISIVLERTNTIGIAERKFRQVGQTSERFGDVSWLKRVLGEKQNGEAGKRANHIHGTTDSVLANV
jgi:hypothetical protein